MNCISWFIIWDFWWDMIWSYLTISDPIRQDLIRFDKIKSDEISSARWVCSGRGSGWGRCAQTCTETKWDFYTRQIFVSSLRSNFIFQNCIERESWSILKNLNQRNLSDSLHHQHPLLPQVRKNLVWGKCDFKNPTQCEHRLLPPLECLCRCCDRRSISECRRGSSPPSWRIR